MLACVLVMFNRKWNDLSIQIVRSNVKEVVFNDLMQVFNVLLGGLLGEYLIFLLHKVNVNILPVLKFISVNLIFMKVLANRTI